MGLHMCKLAPRYQIFADASICEGDLLPDIAIYVNEETTDKKPDNRTVDIQPILPGSSVSAQL